MSSRLVVYTMDSSQFKRGLIFIQKIAVLAFYKPPKVVTLSGPKYIKAISK